ncbi:MAG TPA: 4-hydroxy-3-methylbut-2-enyl diphosphate reductase [Candidatus Cloacimonadota bacterium]|nr:4-hydroxy-3-methylbut-2-enyl diphosphate reductase [Candidatus Cloacimonadota bacterium]
MKIFRAQFSGFCFGVKRAIKMAEEAWLANSGKAIYTLGELIHNPQIVAELKAGGIQSADRASELKDSIVIIRSHGITKAEKATLVANGNILIDATCPYVNRTHELISNMVAENYPVFIFGDKDHPEVIGMLSYGDEQSRVVTGQTDFNGKQFSKLSLISQTTQKPEAFTELASKLLPLCKELRVFNTICLATTERQQASGALASRADLMIVIGGKNSSNTRQLHSICKTFTICLHIETEAELDPERFAGVQTVGLTAGASTPDEMIIKVYNRIKEINRETDFARSIEQIPLFKEESC